jgi:hypothetical protein
MTIRKLLSALISITVCLILLNSCTKNPDGTVTVIPVAPTSLKATTFSTTAINLTWTDNSTNEDGFKIERKTGSSDFSLIATLGADKISYKDSLLTPYTTYTYRVYSYNSVGKSITYTNLDSATTNGVPLLTTRAIDSLSYTSAKSGGIISNSGGASVTAKGIVWSTTNTPSIDLATKTNDGVDTSNYKSSMTGLTPGTIYNVWAYATNSKGTAFGNMVSFTTLAIALPTISTDSVTAITSISAKSGGKITSDGGATITARGVCWSTTANPTTANSKTTDGTGIGTFTSALTGLTSGTAYYVRSYATNSVGTVYGTQVNFTSSSQGYDVYVAGTVNQRATVWKNGVATQLGGTSVNNVNAESVYVVGSNVYVAVLSYDAVFGYNGSVIINGVATQLVGNHPWPKSVFVVGNDVYVAGSVNIKPGISYLKDQGATIWKNGVATQLASGEAYSVFVVGSDVYVAGNNVDQSGKSVHTVWKNGVATQLASSGAVYFRSVFVVGSDVYVAGNNVDQSGKSVPTVWKNGVATQLDSGGGVISIFVVGNDVYVAGADGKSLPTVWKNGVATQLDSGSANNSRVSSLFVVGNDVFVTGYVVGTDKVNHAIFWKNGVATQLDSGSGSSSGLSVFVKAK